MSRDLEILSGTSLLIFLFTFCPEANPSWTEAQQVFFCNHFSPKV